MSVCVCVCVCVMREKKEREGGRGKGWEGTSPKSLQFNPKINSIHALFYWDKLRQ